MSTEQEEPDTAGSREGGASPSTRGGLEACRQAGAHKQDAKGNQ